MEKGKSTGPSQEEGNSPHSDEREHPPLGPGGGYVQQSSSPMSSQGKGKNVVEQTSLVEYNPESPRLRYEQKKRRRMENRKQTRVSSPPRTLDEDPLSWWPTPAEWQLAKANARWKAEMEKMGLPYQTGHMSLSQLDDWRHFFLSLGYDPESPSQEDTSSSSHSDDGDEDDEDEDEDEDVDIEN